MYKEDQATRRNLGEELRSRGDSLARSGRDTAVEEMGRVSTALKNAASSLHEKHDIFGGIADQIASRIDAASDYLVTKEPSDVVNDLNDFARRNTGVVLGGMFLAGFALSRFLKAGDGHVR